MCCLLCERNENELSLNNPRALQPAAVFRCLSEIFQFYWYYSQCQKWKFVRVLIEINKQCVPNIKNEFNTECKVKSCSLLPEYVPCPLCCCLSLFGYPCYTAHLLTPSAAPSIESTAAGEVRLYKVRRFALTETAPNSPLASFLLIFFGGRQVNLKRWRSLFSLQVPSVLSEPEQQQTGPPLCALHSPAHSKNQTRNGGS